MNGYEGFTQVAKKVSRQAGSDTVSPKNPNRKTSIKKKLFETELFMRVYVGLTEVACREGWKRCTHHNHPARCDLQR
jgi:hypothetical protein